ncbi:MAG: NYN domain-containing protein [Candidatus Pacebacteria bacterium]|jgi:uncharacterized LabA/DUF88 family protein|nr:NYN domain-containing protein [Candidatus Paceibacterota bacterium]MDD5013260.1 NYN domain-containing protein [Candidatus Paceibacterota bacterium]
MTHEEIKICLEKFKLVSNRTLTVVDYGNVQKWEEGLGWKIGIKELSNLIKNISRGAKFLRRFYYGSDYGKNEKVLIMTPWCSTIMNKARMNDFEIITKKVKYIVDSNYKTGYVKKCNLDIEMAVDMLIEKNNYDRVVLFSGDGDMAHILKYLKQNHNKENYVFCARNYIGKELLDGLSDGIIKRIFYVEDFDYRLERKSF